MRRKWCFKMAEEMGEKWSPELHFTGSCGDWTEPALVYHLVSKYEDGIEAVYYCEPFPGKAFSIELQFHDRERMLACRKEYARSFNSAGKITPAAVRTIERYKGMVLNG